ncbi:MAG: hypothetical protein IJ862_03535 [Selenomonadaceae bacterium]|nr:hypothetical protein [Selenomonadaceae bacterium]
MKKIKKYFLRFIPLAILIVFIGLEIMSRGAAVTFNQVMKTQDMLRGTITVEKIKATPTGKVSFENLIWNDPQGNTIVDIAEGGFRVRLWDIVTRHFKSTTVQELTLSDANISLHLDKNMQVDFVRHSPVFNEVSSQMKSDEDKWETKISRKDKSEEELKEIGERKRQQQRMKIEKNWKNFNTEGRKLRLKLILKNCNVEIFYRDRHYLIRGVNFESDIDTTKLLTLNVHTGTFGGTAIGRGVEIHGNIDFASKEIPQSNLHILFQDVDPSSLGFGLNLQDQITLIVNLTGPISRPIGDGNLKIKKLHIPGLEFNRVEGDIHYEDSMLIFSNVTAEVYDGKLIAHGDYNLDTRYYNIYGHGEGLKANSALPDSHLHCNVDLDLTVQSKGNARETYTSGSFTSGEGRYSILKFKSLSGKFQTGYRDLRFFDVMINMGTHQISTKALSIINKKLHLEPIIMTDKDGNLLATYIHKNKK